MRKVLIARSAQSVKVAFAACWAIGRRRLWTVANGLYLSLRTSCCGTIDKPLSSWVSCNQATCGSSAKSWMGDGRSIKIRLPKKNRLTD